MRDSQSAKREDRTQRDLLPSRQLQSEYHLHRQSQNHSIYQNIRNRRAQKELIKIVALSWYLRVPVASHRTARNQCRDCEDDPPDQRDHHHHQTDVAEYAHSKDTPIQVQDTELSSRDGQGVKRHEGIERLSGLAQERAVSVSLDFAYLDVSLQRLELLLLYEFGWTCACKAREDACIARQYIDQMRMTSILAQEQDQLHISTLIHASNPTKLRMAHKSSGAH